MQSVGLLEEVAFNSEGLVPVIAQHRLSGEVRMFAWANKEALEQTLSSRQAHFYSRSRKKLWKKGAESGHTLGVQEVWIDCDGDAVVYLVEAKGPSCHTGRETCFFRRLDAETKASVALPVLAALEAALEQRKGASVEKSYTQSLLAAGAEKINQKILEEAQELTRAIEGESDERVASGRTAHFRPSTTWYARTTRPGSEARETSGVTSVPASPSPR